ncbi:MAG: metallophosphoesterase [Sulfobacillus thermotolerans]|nr:metallophosphoesterase [Sulfobacillus thermotolerans]
MDDRASTPRLDMLSRRKFLRGAAGLSAVAAVLGDLPRGVFAQKSSGITPFRFVHLSDTHIGYEGDANRDVAGTLDRSLMAIAALNPAPEFIVVTGDLTQAAETTTVRKARFVAFRSKMEGTGIPFYCVPGEHDALMDRGELYQKAIGPLHYRFERGGVQFFALDNVSRGFFVGDEQRQWLAQEIHKVDPNAPTIILAHAPLYDLFVPWNWYTYDAQQVLALFQHFRSVTVLFGHIHQLMSRRQPHVIQAAGLSTAWPLPEPVGLEKLEKWPQSASDPLMGLGLRVIDVGASGDMAVNTVLLSDERREEASS